MPEPHGARFLDEGFTPSSPDLRDLAQVSPLPAVSYVGHYRGVGTSDLVVNSNLVSEWGQRCTDPSCQESLTAILESRFPDAYDWQYNNAYVVVSDGQPVLIAADELLPYLGTIDSLTEALLGLGGSYARAVKDGYEVIQVEQLKPCPIVNAEHRWHLSVAGEATLLDTTEQHSTGCV